MANEQVNLKVHVHQRAENLLAAIEQTEIQNRNNVINRIVDETINAVEQVTNAPKKSINPKPLKTHLKSRKKIYFEGKIG